LLNGSIETVALTGSSGGGSVPSITAHHPTRSNNVRCYRPLIHQHVPEIESVLKSVGSTPSLHFIPVSVPLSRGIFATSFVRISDQIDERELQKLYDLSYEHEPFVRIPRARLPEVIAIVGSNHVEVGLTSIQTNDHQRVVTVFSALDNLVKGGAGQAIQNLNLMLGLDERLMLDEIGLYP